MPENIKDIVRVTNCPVNVSFDAKGVNLEEAFRGMKRRCPRNTHSSNYETEIYSFTFFPGFEPTFALASCARADMLEQEKINQCPFLENNASDKY